MERGVNEIPRVVGTLYIIIHEIIVLTQPSKH
jgi:hypothetical protein